MLHVLTYLNTKGGLQKKRSRPDDKSQINKGSFNNYVDQILPNFDPLPLEWTIVDI